METYKFGDRVQIKGGKEAIVQEDQEAGSDDIKIMIEGEDYPSVLKSEELEKIPGE